MEKNAKRRREEHGRDSGGDGPSVRRLVAEEERCGRDRPEKETGGWKILDGYIRIHFIGCGGSFGGLSSYPRRAENSESSRFSWERRSQSVSLKLPHDGR